MEIAPVLPRSGLRDRFAGAEAAAKSLGIALRRVDATNPADLAAAFAAIEQSSSQALRIQSDPMLTGTEFSQVLEFAVARRLPAGYVAKILKGAKQGICAMSVGRFSPPRIVNRHQPSP
jgi:hypothetical protein